MAKKTPKTTIEPNLVTNITKEAMADLYGMKSVVDGGKLFCGVSEEHFAINGTTFQWPKGIKTLTWGVMFARLGNLSDMDMKDMLLHCFEEVATNCDLNFEYVAKADKANLYMVTEEMDGKSGVLADAQVPMGNVTQASRFRLRYDIGEAWCISDNPPQGSIDAYRTSLHEILHLLGLGHKPVDVSLPALISPTYSRTIRNLQPVDIEELQRRYDPSKKPQPVVPLPTPGAQPIMFEGVITNGPGKTWVIAPVQAIRRK